MLGVIILSEMNPEDEVSAQECEEENDPILEFAIEYVLHRTYPSGLTVIEGEEESSEKESRSSHSRQRRSIFEEEGAPCESRDRC